MTFQKNMGYLINDFGTTGYSFKGKLNLIVLSLLLHSVSKS